jgi:hypothetical protein
VNSVPEPKPVVDVVDVVADSDIVGLVNVIDPGLVVPWVI